MSLITSDIPSDNESIAITENSNKRKFEEIDSIVKKYKLETPTFNADVDSVPSEEDQPNSILSDVTETESTDSTEQNDKPSVTFGTPTSVSGNSSAKNEKTEENATQIVCPQFGQLVNRREFRRAGPYIIGLKLGQSPVDSIVQYLAKKENTNEFVQLKVCLNFVYCPDSHIRHLIIALYINIIHTDSDVKQQYIE